MLFNLIQEINLLWKPVYPHLARYIAEIYGRRDGDVLEIGPFPGVIFALQKQQIGEAFSIAAFPPGMGKFFLQEARAQEIEDTVTVLETDPSLTGVEEETIDLAIFRGAFFFPSLFEVDLPRIDQVLKPDGLALVGGGFGKFTPDEIIRDIGKSSRDLNLKIGKTEVKEDDLRQSLKPLNLKGNAEVITEGGLWVVIRK